MQPQTKNCRENSLSVAEYASAVAQNGVRALPGTGDTLWARYERGSIQRVPTFYLAPPGPGEVRRILWNGRAAVVSYIVDPDKHHPANAWLYTCRDSNYSVEKLSRSARRNVRYARCTLQFSSVELPSLLRHGFSAYRDTFTRLGLAIDTVEGFQRGLEFFSRNPAHRFVGAWEGDN